MRVLLLNLSLFLPSQRRRTRRFPSSSPIYEVWAPVLFGWCARTPVRICLSVFPMVPHLVPCCLDSNLLFFAIRHPLTPTLGGVVSQLHPCSAMGTLQYPQYPAVPTVPTVPCSTHLQYPQYRDCRSTRGYCVVSAGVTNHQVRKDAPGFEPLSCYAWTLVHIEDCQEL